MGELVKARESLGILRTCFPQFPWFIIFLVVGVVTTGVSLNQIGVIIIFVIIIFMMNVEFSPNTFVAEITGKWARVGFYKLIPRSMMNSIPRLTVIFYLIFMVAGLITEEIIVSFFCLARVFFGWLFYRCTTESTNNGGVFHRQYYTRIIGGSQVIVLLSHPPFFYFGFI